MKNEEVNKYKIRKRYELNVYIFSYCIGKIEVLEKILINWNFFDIMQLCEF